MFRLGVYLTECGLKAVVAKIDLKVTKRILLGAISDNDQLLHLHKWDAKGKSLTKDKDFDLVKEVDE